MCFLRCVINELPVMERIISMSVNVEIWKVMGKSRKQPAGEMDH